ncbi:MAG: tetratricopeptide repeat protein [Acidobacteriota bacterium]|nr:tetratricopeptide repeat protein [Acidobacteriota bacterium]
MFRLHPFFTFPCLCLIAFTGFGQTNAQPKIDKAAAYYYYALGHLYAEQAAASGKSGDLFGKAVDNYKLALKADPSATFISEELSDLYVQAGRLREAVTEAEETLKQNPEDLSSRRILARIYTRMIGDAQAQKIDENMVKKAIEQFQLIAAKDPKDIESWLMLGRLYKISQNSLEAEKAYKKALEIDAANEDAMTGLAMVYSDLGDTKGATDLLRRAAEKNPTPRSLSTLATAYEQLKDYALAAATFKRALDAAPGNVEIERALAQDLLFADQLDEALKIYQQLVEEDPKDLQSQLRISQIYRQKRDFSHAREAANKAKEIDPTNLEVEYNDVNLLDAEGKVPEAVKTLSDILATTAKKTYNASERANRVMLLERLGFLYRSSEQWAPAVETFRLIGELDPDAAAKSAAQVVETYRIAKDFPKAEQEADAGIKKYPNDRVMRSVRASLLADMGKTDQAVAETRKLLDGKNDRDTYIALAQIYEKAKNYSEMGKALDQAGKLSTSKDDQESIHFLRGSMLERQKNYDAAEAEFRKVLELNPDNGSALNYFGYMLADRNVRLTEAHDMIKKALDHDPNNGAYLDSLGWVLFRMNKLDEAERSLRRSLELMSKDPTVHDHLGDVYFRAGKIREAIAQWQTSLKEWQVSPPSEVDPVEISKVQKKLDSAKVRLAREPGSANKQQP